jgi:methionyl-tRNA formyltransferase
MRIVLFGDGQWAANAVRRLVAAGHDIPLVAERQRPSDGSLADTARELGISVVRPPDVNDARFVQEIAGHAPDLNLSVSFEQILRADIVATAPLGFVNFHGGKLPFYRGRNVVNWALINGETEIGLTAHYVDAGIDTGDIIAQTSLPIAWTDTYADVLARLFEALPDLAVQVVADIAAGRATRRPQAAPGTYFSVRRPGDEWIDWTDSSRDIYNKIRAITRPGPGALTLLGDALVKIWRAELDPSWPAYIATPGEVVGRTGHGVFIKTGDSRILLTEVEVDGRGASVPRWKIGTRFGMNLPQAFRDLQERLDKLERTLSRAASGVR